MCKVHWNHYTASLARDAKARKAAETAPAEGANPFSAEPERHARRPHKPQVAMEGDIQPS